MWRNSEKDNNMMKDDKKIFENDDGVDSGFLSGSQLLDSVEISDIRPEIPKKSEKNINTDNKSGYLDSGYIDETTDKCTERFSNLNIKASTDLEFKKTNIQSEKGPQMDNSTSKKEKWETYFQQNEDGDTQLHWACLTGYVDVVAAFIRLTPHPCLLDIQNDDSQTALHLAAFSGQPKIIRMLLIAGADQTIQDHDGNTPLHTACMCGNLQCVKAFTEKINVCELKEAQDIYLNRHYDFGVKRSSSALMNNQIDILKIMSMSAKALEMRNYDGERCVHLAAQGDFIEILRQLICCGADINSREGKSGRSPLHIAIEQRNEKVVNFLLEEGSKFNLDLETCTYGGFTAFQFACILENPMLQKHLEKMGAEAIEPDSDSDSSDGEYNMDNSLLSLCVN